MSDLIGVNDTLPVRLGGVSSSSGLPDNYADVNSGGSLQVAGQGTAGTPAGGVISIQGVTGGTAVPVSQSGTWTIQQGTPPWTIQGDSASGSSKAGNPIQIGGVFNTTQPTVTTGQTVEAQSTSRGALIVSTGVDSFNINNISGTISIPSGASTSANQSTEITSLQLIDNPVGSVGAGTAGSSSYLIGGVFNTSLPSLTTGQQAALQLDSSGRLTISPLTNTSIVKAQLQDNSGTAITLGQKTMSSSVPVTLASDQSTVQVEDVINVSASQATLSVSNTATACRVGASNLIGRRQLIISVASTGFSYGYASGSQPFSLPNGTTLIQPYGPNITVWVVRSTGVAANVFIAELA